MDPLFGEQYHDKFDTQTYLRVNYTLPTLFRTFPLPHLYGFYRSLGNNSLRILEVGAGPSIACVISAAPYASEIVLSEYTENNRKAVLQWLDKSTDAHNWMPYFKHIVIDVEGGEEKDIEVRQEKLRSSIKAVIPCDVSKDMILPAEYMGQYDVLQSIVCLENVCERVHCINGVHNTRRKNIDACLYLQQYLRSRENLKKKSVFFYKDNSLFFSIFITRVYK